MRCNFFQCGHLFKCQTDRRGWKYEIRRLTQQREKPYLFCLFTSTVLFKWGSFIFYESRWKLSEVLKLELRYKPKMCSLIHDTVTFNTAAAAVFINVQRSWSSRSCVHERACACTFDGTVPAQLSLRSPVTGAPHRGAGSSDGRLLLGIYGKWQLPLNKTEAVGEGKTTEVPNRECTGLTLAEIYFLRSAWQFGWKCAIHTFRPADRVRASEREGAPPLIYFLCLG